MGLSDGTTHPRPRPAVEVQPPGAVLALRSLLMALEEAFEVRFTAAPGGGAVAGLLRIGEDAPSSEALVEQRLPVLAFADTPEVVSGTSEVRLLPEAGVDRRLQHAVLAGQLVGPALKSREGDELLALSGEGCVWTRRADGRGLQRVAMPLPVLEEGMTLFEALHGPHALAVIALVQFLRALAPDVWIKPPLRASFVLDDPNLRRDRYGFVDYRQLVEHADAHGYHIAMAMIPLDVGRWSEDPVAVFRQRPDRLSLVTHGNNHVLHELNTGGGVSGAFATAAQAARRMAWFETRTGLAVDRVMVPPHEAWSKESARALGALGYSALCAANPYPSAEAGLDATVLSRWRPAEFLEGCAVIPRFPLWLNRTAIALRAFLDHPLILYGHHDDLAPGLEPLQLAASIVNSLGDVQWSSLGEIVDAGHELSVAGEMLAVRPWGQRMRVSVPSSSRRLTVLEPAGDHPSGLAGWTLQGAGGQWRTFGQPVAAPSGDALIRLRSTRETDINTVASPRLSVPAVARRRFSEARDRVAPVRAGHRRSGSGVPADGHGPRSLLATSYRPIAAGIQRRLNKPYYVFRPSQVLRRATLPLRETRVDGQFVEIVSPWGLPLRFRALDKTGLCYSRRGIFDLPVCEVLWRLSDPGELVLDVGANIGQMTSVLASAVGDTGRVFSFEPHPEIFPVLTENARRWNASLGSEMVVVRNVAIGAASGTAMLGMTDEFDSNMGTASITTRAETTRKIEVPMQRLDVEFDGAAIGVMKVDVEGHELGVFKGAEQLLRSGRIRDTVFEELAELPTPATQLLESLGYSIFSLDQGPLGPIVAQAGASRERRSGEDPSYLATLDPERALRRLSYVGWGVLGVRASRLRRSFLAR